MQDQLTHERTEPAYTRESYAVWELTLKCNLACNHCGSRAGNARPDELSTAEALDLVEQLDELGITEVTIEGGEAFLRADWLTIAQAITDRGMRCTMATGGYGVSQETAQRIRDVGIGTVSVSIDGLEQTHDALRGKTGAWRSARTTLGHLQRVGVVTGVNTQLNRRNVAELPRLYEVLRDSAVAGWQFQLTLPMGNAADYPEMLLQPSELVDFYSVLARVMRRAAAEGMALNAGNNIGYNGPYEHVLRPAHNGRRRVYLGCQAGVGAIGIHANGDVKACPTLPAHYVGGNVRDTPLSEIVDRRRLAFNLTAGTADATADLWGFCRGCEHAKSCRAGCAATAHTLLGKRGNNPFCHHRALALRAAGKRERIAQKLVALGKSFDHGQFRIIEEPYDAPWPDADHKRFAASHVDWPGGIECWPLEGSDVRKKTGDALRRPKRGSSARPMEFVSDPLR